MNMIISHRRRLCEMVIKA